jgi:hypothetical protein
VFIGQFAEFPKQYSDESQTPVDGLQTVVIDLNGFAGQGAEFPSQ